MSLDEEVLVLEDVISRIDGHTIGSNIGNRLFGLASIGMGALCYKLGTDFSFPFDIIPYAVGTGFIIDGIGTFATGKLHYVLSRVTKCHPKYELEKLKKNI